MLSRRSFLQSSSLLACGATVPEFLARTASAAAPGLDRVLVVVELTGGNDGLNTVVPYADDLYYKNRPGLGLRKSILKKIDDHIGLHPRLDQLHRLHKEGQLAIVQGVGYPNPNRSHFESMDVWQSADPTRRIETGWIGRASPLLTVARGVPAMYLGADKLPLALQGSAGSVLSVNKPGEFGLRLTGADDRTKARRDLIERLNKDAPAGDDLTAFVRRRQVQALASSDLLREAVERKGAVRLADARDLDDKLSVVARLINAEFGTRIFYVSLDGFDTHSRQADTHGQLLDQLDRGVRSLFQQVDERHRDRVLLLTYSEFGRRVKENGSRGTDHGAGSCLFVAGSGVKAGPVNPHPSLADLDAGDLKYSVDFRRVYATLLDGWLGVDSKAVLGGRFEHLGILKKA